MKKCVLVLILLACIGVFASGISLASASQEYTVSSYEQLADAMYSAAYSLCGDFTIKFTDQRMYDAVCDSRTMMELYQHVGIHHAYTWHYTDPSYRTIGFKDITYYPGARCAWAWATGNTSFLTNRERDTLNAAEKLLRGVASKCRDTLSTEKAIHDALIKKVTYDRTVSQDYLERDTAIGALLNGRADCDGYADAFYLLCYMKGMNVRYMHVTDYVNPGEHMLNQVQLDDGRWYLVDVTWDDIGKASPIYRCFNIGAGMAGYYYDWNRQLFKHAVPEHANDRFVQTSYSFAPESMALNSLAEAKTYIQNLYRNGCRHIVFTIRGTGVTYKQLNKLTNKRHWAYSWNHNGYSYCEMYFY